MKKNDLEKAKQIIAKYDKYHYRSIYVMRLLLETLGCHFECVEDDWDLILYLPNNKDAKFIIDEQPHCADNTIRIGFIDGNIIKHEEVFLDCIEVLEILLLNENWKELIKKVRKEV